MKNKINKMKGFTLVELLIVIALIAILSVAVLATINPIEQSNKAKDSTVQNDAAEVLNAYERYYTNGAHYPWMDVTGSLLKVDGVWYGKSDHIGFGLCSTTGALGADKEHTTCSEYNTQGALITTQELKDSFLEKQYTMKKDNSAQKDTEMLYVVKKDVSTGNSIYVCYVPKATSNRKFTSGLVNLFSVNDGTKTVPDQYVPAVDTDFTPDGSKPIAKWTFADASTSLFKCVP